ncbi:MAG: hypothetical protein JWM12_252 [Ilumatobacteraceae bacterium]|nr:hypothetical protein [Ilumatobacteraceae bacterium]
MTRAMLVVALVLGGVATTTAANTSTAGATPPGAARVTLIGDSTMAALRWYKWDDGDPDTSANNDIREIIGNTYDLLFSAESCRRLVAGSCRGREGYTPSSTLPLMRGDFRGQMGKVVVLMAGYDDVNIAASIGPVMQEAIAQGVEKVVWLTYRSSTTYRLPDGTSAANLYQEHNDALTAAAAQYPQLDVLDWNAYTVGHPEWFANDDIHLTPAGAVDLTQFIKAKLDTMDVLQGRCSASNALTGRPSGPIGTPAPVTAVDAGYVARTPVRVLDTRDPALGGAAGKVGAGRTVTVDAAATLPANATAAVMTVTAVDPCAAGFLTVFACDVRPETSNINYDVGRDTAGMVITALDPAHTGNVCIHSYATTDIVVDVVGAFVPGGDTFHAMEPTRWTDTRGGPSLLTNLRGTAVTGADLTIPMAGVGGVPAGASAVWLNLTVADPKAATVLTAYPGPCGTAPTASTVNAIAGRSAASSAIVGLGPDGSICVHTVAGSSGIVTDVAGWFGGGASAGPGLRYRPHPPTRLLDTRIGASKAPSATVALPLATTAVLNVTAAESTALGYLTVRPCGSSQTSSLVNTAGGQNMANLTAVGPGAGGQVCITPYTPTHVVVDSFGDLVPAAG